VDFARWANATGQTAEADGGVTVTYVVDGEGVLRIADRRSEHIACAGGRPVRSAGEMTLAAKGEHVAVLSVSNQSTGFCPEPESWPAVEEALRRASFAPPFGFSPACVFRRCAQCGGVNLVKGGVFGCDVCEAELPAV
jgi:hypothetical protein